jgi:hypothetical protein
MVVDALRAQTGLAITVRPAGDACIDVPLLRESLFDWTFEPHAVAVFSFVPAHPYLWENLDAAMLQLGGRNVLQPPHWQPDPRHASLRKPWTELGALQRWTLRLPTVAASRPLDRLLC